jgi:hypothetical protein
MTTNICPSRYGAVPVSLGIGAANAANPDHERNGNQMIEVNRKDNEVEIKVTLLVPHYDNRVFTFSFNCGAAVYAGLLTQHIKNEIWTHVKKLRAEAYEQGWADAKAKRQKQTWFKSSF